MQSVDNNSHGQKKGNRPSVDNGSFTPKTLVRSLLGLPYGRQSGLNGHISVPPVGFVYAPESIAVDDELAMHMFDAVDKPIADDDGFSDEKVYSTPTGVDIIVHRGLPSDSPGSKVEKGIDATATFAEHAEAGMEGLSLTDSPLPTGPALERDWGGASQDSDFFSYPASSSDTGLQKNIPVRPGGKVDIEFQKMTSARPEGEVRENLSTSSRIPAYNTVQNIFMEDYSKSHATEDRSKSDPEVAAATSKIKRIDTIGPFTGMVKNADQTSKGESDDFPPVDYRRNQSRTNVIAPTSGANMEGETQIQLLRQSFHELISKKAGVRIKNEGQENAPVSKGQELSPVPQVVIVNRPSINRDKRRPSAYWERSYMGRLQFRVTR